MNQHVRSTVRLIVLSAVLIAALFTSACGGGGNNVSENNNQGNQQQQGTQAKTINVESGEFYFKPNEITVNKGETVTLVVKNGGSVKHNISIDEFNVSRDYGPNETVRVTFTPNKTGDFKIYCNQPGHTESGMVGTLTVK